MFSGFICVFVYIRESLLLLQTVTLYAYTTADGHLDCFHNLAVKNNAAVNICVQVLVCVYVCLSLYICFHYSWVYA